MAKVEWLRRHHFENAAAECRRPRWICRATHDQELFPAPANQYIRLTNHGRKPLRDQLQEPVSCGMPVQIIHLLEEIDIDHDEHQVAMIHLPDVCSVRALIISQNLSCFRSHNLFKIAPIPNAGKHIGERDLL